MDYRSFVSAKLGVVASAGLTGDIALPEPMFPHPALTRWALRKGPRGDFR